MEYGVVQFPARDHPWLASTRAAKIEKLAVELLRSFHVFAKYLPNSLDQTRNIITHAVRLNEYMMHEAEVTYTLDLDDEPDSDSDFYNNLNDMTMTAVNTDNGSRVWVDRTMKGMLESDIREKLYKVCTIEPALRHRNWQGADAFKLQWGPVETEVKASVAVGWALNKNNPPEKESLFYIMAKSLGIVPSAEPSKPTEPSSEVESDV